ncbi:TadE family type IV pilus minor pilin [Actinotalea sp. Marseille-Q4924]|uniref:TadE family type IV pilus minor pilin n=1 Tax=Actinotalea sp. Marseille-Q4924 TaxID=2866571 RepID=UPI001CE405B1|nr:TadE family type IV pilus minor pilin [Actinotalea sp. Marseille-Q4924]
MTVVHAPLRGPRPGALARRAGAAVHRPGLSTGRGGTGRPGGPHPSDSERGAVTAELALALPAVVLVLAVVLATVAAGAAQLRCADAARAGARAAAIGEDHAEVRAVARRVAGDRAVVEVGQEAEWVTVVVSTTVPGAWFTGGRLTVRGSATAWVEP